MASIPVVNLYGENGIAIYLSKHSDILTQEDVDRSRNTLAVDEANPYALEDRPVVKVIGHRLYVSSIEGAEESIRAAYLDRNPLAV